MEKVLLLGWWFAPFFALALFGRVLYPRFVLFMVMPLIVLSAVTFEWIFQKIRPRILSTGVILVLCFFALRLSFLIISDIKTAPIPVSDAGQYINGWPSGWGNNEIVAFLNKESQDKPIAVYTEGTFGLYPYALEIYLSKNKNVEIHGIWPPPETLPSEIKKSAEEKPTYFVVYQKGKPERWPLVLLSKYQKGNDPNVFTYLYKVELPKE